MRPERTAWRPRLRWLGAEILVVVAGVLIALAIDAWWADRQSAAQERVYLRQLAADLQVTADRLESSEAAMRRAMNVSSSLLIAFNDPSEADADSVERWVGDVVWYQRPGLALGVARALVSTDLSVVRDDSIRTAIFDLLTEADQYRAFDEETFRTFISYSNQLRPLAPMAWRITTYEEPRFPRSSYYPVLPFEPDERVAYPLDVEAFLRNREAYVVIDGLYDAAADMRYFQTVMLRSVRALQDLLARRGIAVGEASSDGESAADEMGSS